MSQSCTDQILLKNRASLKGTIWNQNPVSHGTHYITWLWRARNVHSVVQFDCRKVQWQLGKSDSERLRVLLLFCYFKRILQEKQEQNEPRSDSYSMCLMFHDISRSLLNLQVALLEEFNPVLSSCNFLCSLLSCKSVNFVLVANSMCSLDRNGVKWVPDGDELLRKLVPSVQPDHFLGNCTFELVEFVQICRSSAIPWLSCGHGQKPQ